MERPFLAFSKTVYLPNNDIMVIGGLDDFVPNKPTFSAKSFLIQEVPVNSYDNLYIQNNLKPMQSKRGCFSAIYHEGFVFVFGGLNYTEKILRKSERFCFQEQRWEPIAEMNEARKNSSACALTSDTVYVIGGTSLHACSDTIEQYSIATNKWNTLKIRLPSPISFVSSLKLSNTEILLLGGSVKEHSKRSATYKTNQVTVLNVIKPSFTRVRNLPKDVLSLYPPFYDDGKVFLVDEDGKGENPAVVPFDLAPFIN